jgi:hypothetical protein
MRTNWTAAGAWVVFALVVVACGERMLSACDLGWQPLFGLRYCRAEAAPDPIAAERARELELRAKLHEVELRIARLPACAPPPRQEPSRAAPPQRTEATPPQQLPPAPPPPEELTIPRTLADLKGCWQSVRGDLPIVTDDEEQRPLGKVRICYCFDDNGRGNVRYTYTDGERCTTTLRTRLSPDQLSFTHRRLRCDHRRGYIVPAETVCKSDAPGTAATCDRQTYGRISTKQTGERYRRVSEEHCR